MDNTAGFIENQLCRKVSKDGVTLNVISTKVSEGEWELAVLNETGDSSNCLEFFPTAQSAIDAGIKAIQKDSLAEFSNLKFFD